MESKEKVLKSPERIDEVQKLVEGLMNMVDANKLVEVDSTQPENLKQYEVKDALGNMITYIRNVISGNLEAPIEVRDSKGKLIAQSWDEIEWSVDSYIENGPNFALVRP